MHSAISCELSQSLNWMRGVAYVWTRGTFSTEHLVLNQTGPFTLQTHLVTWSQTGTCLSTLQEIWHTNWSCEQVVQVIQVIRSTNCCLVLCYILNEGVNIQPLQMQQAGCDTDTHQDSLIAAHVFLMFPDTTPDTPTHTPWRYRWIEVTVSSAYKQGNVWICVELLSGISEQHLSDTPDTLNPTRSPDAFWSSSSCYPTCILWYSLTPLIDMDILWYYIFSLIPCSTLWCLL